MNDFDPEWQREVGVEHDFDPERHRRASLEQWEAAAPGWARWQAAMRDFAGPASAWMLDALDLRPGQRVLDIAAGVGDTGLLAARRVAPAGGVVLGDQAEGMLQAARARARELGVENVEVRQLNAEWLDLPTATLDAVLCRWGFMLMADREAALRECRRVLRPGGAIALAVWSTPQRNPWVTVPMAVLSGAQADFAPAWLPAAREGPAGMFALADRDELADTLREAGFTEVAVAAVELVRRHASFEEFWQCTLDVSGGVHDLVMEKPAAEIERIEGEIRRRLERYVAADGTVAIPAETLVARASA